MQKCWKISRGRKDTLAPVVSTLRGRAVAPAVPTPLPSQNNKRTDKPAAVVAAGGVEATRGGKVVAIPGVVGGTAVETVAGSGVVPVQRQLYDEVHSKSARIGLQQSCPRVHFV